MNDRVTARDLLVDAIDGLDADEADRLTDGDASLAEAHLDALDEARTWVYALAATMTVFAVVIPTAGLYQFFRAVNNLEPIELIGIIAATCVVAGALTVVPVLTVVNWRRRRLCYRALLALERRPSDDAPSDS